MKVPFHSLIWIQPTKLSQFWFSAFQSNSAATLIKTSPWYFSKQNKTNNEKRDDSLIFQMETNISQISKVEIDCYLESKTWIHTRGAVLFCFANVLWRYLVIFLLSPQFTKQQRYKPRRISWYHHWALPTFLSVWLQYHCGQQERR